MADSTTDTENTGTAVTATNGIVTEIADKAGHVYDIAAKRFAKDVTVKITGAVEGTVDAWDGKEQLEIATTIPEKSIKTGQIADGAITTGKIADDAVTLDKIDDDAIGTSIAESSQSNLLAKQGAVKTYVDAQIAGKGSYLGKMTVDAVNALDASSLHNGDRLMVSGTGTIVHGEGGKPYVASDGEDFILYKVSDTEYEWQSIDGNFKLKGTAQDWSSQLGGTKIITTLKQDADGDLTVETETITSASPSNSGIAKLYSTTGSNEDGSVTQKLVTDELAKKQDGLAFDGTYSSDTNKVATVSSVTSRINALDADITSTAGTNVNVEVTQVDGKITAITVSDASAKASDLSQEITDRKAADKTLQDNIDAEAKTRGDADSALDTRVKSLEADTHKHSNKAVLDAISAGDVTNWDDANAMKHVHGNQAVLDAISSERVTQWDTAYTNNHTHTKAQYDAMNSGATAAKVTGYDAHLADGDIHVTKDQKETWDAKQTAISDLDTIRAGAAKGATAVQPKDKLSTLTDDITVDTYSGTSEAPISGIGVKAAIDTLDSNATSTDGTNVQVKVTQENGKITAVNVTSDTTASAQSVTDEAKARSEADEALQANIDKKQDIVSDLDTIRSGAAKGATSVQPNDNLSTLTDDITVDTYSGTSEAPISGKGVKAAIDTLDSTVTSSTAGANVQVKVTQTDGKITAVDIASDSTATAKSVTDEASARAAADTTLQSNIDKKQDILDVEYDAAKYRITFKNVTFTVVENV